MADHTAIEWTDATWNPITGCSIESPGCRDCYAMTLAGTRLRNHPSRIGLTKRAANGAHVWTGEVRFNAGWLEQPLRWTRPRMVFVVAHGDLFHPGVPDEWIDKVFAVMARARWHTYQVLTKRAKRMREYLSNPDTYWRILKAGMEIPLCAMESMPWPLPQVWAGVSVEDQPRANKRIPELLKTPAAVRWLSMEPLIRRVDVRAIRIGERLTLDALTGTHAGESVPVPRGRDPRETFGTIPALPEILPPVDWIVAGGESGGTARPMHPDWLRLIRDQCISAHVPLLFKQWGTFIPADQEESRNFCYDDEACEHVWDRNSPTGYSIRVGKKAAGRVLDGRTWDEFPRTHP
jgi:protein gp37